MDKAPVYPGLIPRDVDVLQPQRNVEIALGFALQAAFGTTTVFDGLAATQTAVPSMSVLVGPGSILFATTVDTLTTGFGSLAVDNADPLVKIGINLTPTTMGALTPPVTAGYSVNVLIEAQFIEADGAPVVLPYYNSANPAVPYEGPSNSGAPNNTARTNRVQLQYKYGTAAASGSQVTPSPDAGWLGVAVVTVANGASTIVNANITPYVGASGVTSIPTKLPFLRQKLTSNLSLYVSATGSDSNSGLSASVPFATLQKAWNTTVNNYDLAGFSLTVNVANGTYTQGLAAQGAVTGLGTGNAVMFVGNTSTPQNVALTVSNQHGITAAVGANISVSGFDITASGSISGIASCGVFANAGGNIQIASNMLFGPCAGAHIWASAGGTVGISSSYFVNGGATAHYQVTGGGALLGAGYTCNISGSPAFSNAFAYCTQAGFLQILGCTFTGSITGTRYNATLNGVVNTAGGGASYFPGTAAGTTASGGEYA